MPSSPEWLLITQTIAQIVALMATPLVVAWIAHKTSRAISNRDSSTKMIELAIGVLRSPPEVDGQGDEDRRIRRWAVDVLNKYSEVPLPPETAETLEHHQLRADLSGGHPTPRRLTHSEIGEWVDRVDVTGGSPGARVSALVQALRQYGGDSVHSAEWTTGTNGGHWEIAGQIAFSSSQMDVNKFHVQQLLSLLEGDWSQLWLVHVGFGGSDGAETIEATIRDPNTSEQSQVSQPLRYWPQTEPGS